MIDIIYRVVPGFGCEQLAPTDSEDLGNDSRPASALSPNC